MRRTIAALTAAAVSAVAAPAMAQQYIAYAVVDYPQPVSITFVNARHYGGDLTYEIQGNGLLRVQKPMPNMVIRVRFADGTSYTTQGNLSEQTAVRGKYDPSTKYWCLFVEKDNIGLNTTDLCPGWAEGDSSVVRN